MRLVEERRLTLAEICRLCHVEEEEIRAWVLEGLLDPTGDAPQDWRFGDASLRRARAASRLSRDLGINLAGLALTLDLLDDIAALRARLDALRAFDDADPTDPDL